MKLFRSEIAGAGTEDDPRYAVAITIGDVKFLEDRGDHMIVGYEDLSPEDEQQLADHPGIEVV